MKLNEQTCSSKFEAIPLSGREVQGLLVQVPGWTAAESAIRREFKLKDFRKSLELVNRVAAIAEEQDHHPDIRISYNRVVLVLTTHKSGGLTMNDFIIADRKRVV